MILCNNDSYNIIDYSRIHEYYVNCMNITNRCASVLYPFLGNDGRMIYLVFAIAGEISSLTLIQTPAQSIHKGPHTHAHK